MPATTDVAPATRGVVRDAHSHQPVSGATVVAGRVGYHTTTRTDTAGFFHLPPLRQWHYLVYIGSPGVCPEPWWCRHSPDERYDVSVHATGYQPASCSFAP